MQKYFISLVQVLFFASISFGQNSQSIISTFVNRGNIFIKLSNNSVKQITFSNSDLNPFLLKKRNEIVFTRKTYCDVDNPEAIKIMTVNLSSLLEKTLVSKKPEQDGSYFTTCLMTVTNPTLSLDEKYLYFITEAYTTSGGLVKVNLETGKWISLFDADFFELIKQGQYSSLLLVGKSEIKDKGRDIYYYLMNEKNQKLKEFETKQNYQQFKKSIGMN